MSLAFHTSYSSIFQSSKQFCRKSFSSPLFANFEDDSCEGERDWRSFRASLVSNERKQATSSFPSQLSSTYSPIEEYEVISDQFIMEEYESVTSKPKSRSWIYDAGQNIEPGSLLLHNPNPHNDGNDSSYRFSLNQQWLHKSIILILEHDENDPTMKSTGIILNRPTDLILQESRNDECNQDDFYICEHSDDVTCEKKDEDGWNIFFGGEEFGLHSSLDPKFYCLHSLETQEAMEVSNEIISGIYFCSLQDARKLHASGFATYADFWVFSGFQSWDQSDLKADVQSGIWHVVATDCNLVQKGKRILSSAPLDRSKKNSMDRVWSIFMRLIGQHVHPCNGSLLCDKILQKWELDYLEFDVAPDFILNESTISHFENGQKLRVGDMIQTKAELHETFMADPQFYKSTILILQDDDEMTVGTMLNLPSAFNVKLFGKGEESSFIFDEDIVTLPLRYGGQLGAPIYGDKGCSEVDPLFSFHNSQTLRDLNIGEPIGEDHNGIWKCSFEEISDALREGQVFIEDVAIVNGISIWYKEQLDDGSLISDLDGKYNIISHANAKKVWNELSSLEPLNANNLDKTFEIVQKVWRIGDCQERSASDLDCVQGEIFRHWCRFHLLGSIQ